MCVRMWMDLNVSRVCVNCGKTERENIYALQTEHTVSSKRQSKKRAAKRKLLTCDGTRQDWPECYCSAFVGAAAAFSSV